MADSTTSILLTIAEACSLAEHCNLTRTQKTVRSWARNGDVEARKQTTQTGSQWLIDKTSLEIKIQQELEFQAQQEARQTATTPKQGANPSEPVRTGSHLSEPAAEAPLYGADEQTRTDTAPFEPERTGSNPSDDNTGENSANQNATNREELRSLRNQLQQLEIDVGWRREMIIRMEQKIKQDENTLMGQSRYIGHLETKISELGGKPDQQFLDAPTPQTAANDTVESDHARSPEIIPQTRPHPDQGHFFST